MKIITSILMILLVALLSSCVNTNNSVEEYIEENPDYKDDQVLQSQNERVQFDVYLINYSSEKKYLYEFSSEDIIENIMFFCEGNDAFEYIDFIALTEYSQRVGYIPQFDCDTRVEVKSFRFGIGSGELLGYIEEWIK